MARRAPQSVHATLPIRRAIEPTDMAALAYIMINSALTGATYDIDGRQQFVGAATLSSRSPSWRNEHDAITGSESQASGVKIRFVIGQTSIAATLDDSGTTKDFTSRLPLELELKNLVAREKSGDLPRALLEDAPRTYTYEVGDVVYWPPGPHVAVFYRQDGRTVTSGMIRLGAVDAGVDALAPSSSVRATIELAK